MKPSIRTVAVCAATYRRPKGLSALVESLCDVQVPDGWQMVVVIADNDSEGSARATLDALDTESLDISYAVEPAQGIPIARNKTTELAMDLGADAIAFIDDDEWAEPAWLTELLDARDRHAAPIVMGAVIAEYEQTPPAWAVEVGSFQRKMFPDGQELNFAITANVLLDTTILDGNSRPFDETLRYSGGEDLHLFQLLNRRGHRIVYAPAARTHELIPTSRVTKSWVIKRQFRRGTNRSSILRKLNFTASTLVKRIGGGLVELALGFGVLIAGSVRGESTRLRGRMQMSYGAGLLVGLTGKQYEEYRTTHGS